MIQKKLFFGSYADGNPTEDSDLDILIIKEMDIPRYRRALAIRKYLRGLKIPIDLIVYNQKEINKWENTKTAFITQVLGQGKVLYERKRRTH